jgi:L-asparagine transporter-like permease
MKQNKFMRFMTSRALILTLQVVASGVLLYFVYLTKLLPVKYFAILAAVLAVLVLLFWIIIQTGKKKIVEGKNICWNESPETYEIERLDFLKC